LRHSIKSTFVLNIDHVVENTLNKIVETAESLDGKNWKDVLFKDEGQSDEFSNLSDLVGDILEAVKE